MFAIYECPTIFFFYLKSFEGSVFDVKATFDLLCVFLAVYMSSSEPLCTVLLSYDTRV